MQDIINRTKARPAILETYAPARLDRLPWGRFHTLVVIALGITWVLDGLEVTLAGSVAGALKESPVLHFTDSEVGLASSFYLAGAVITWLLRYSIEETQKLARERFCIHQQTALPGTGLFVKQLVNANECIANQNSLPSST